MTFLDIFRVAFVSFCPGGQELYFHYQQQQQESVEIEGGSTTHHHVHRGHGGQGDREIKTV